MHKIGIAGINTSHAYVFGGYINGINEADYFSSAPGWTYELFAGDKEADRGFLRNKGHITVCWDSESENAVKLSRACGIDRTAPTLEDMAGEVDAVMILEKDGAKHLEMTRPFLEAGLPVFIDKPLAGSYADASAIKLLANENRATAFSYSAFRYAEGMDDLRREIEAMGGASFCSVCAPCHESFTFYGIHGLEMLMSLVSKPVRSVEDYPDAADRHLVKLDFVDGSKGILATWHGLSSYSVFVSNGQGKELNSHFGTSTVMKDVVVRIVDQLIGNEPPLPLDETLEIIRIVEQVERTARYQV
ncbi:MAG: Gfo/Idh/MocA family oxidoreductase [bacterium]|nr:Gfo/Idh/MocA family oxidoreductase [bacterium]